MPKKQLFYLVLIVLFGALIWFLSTDKKSTIITDNNFSVSDTASVSKIFIADRNGTTITLGKTGNKWIVNNKYGVRKDAIKTILSTINQIKIQRPVPINAFDNVVKNLATTGVKVEIYTDKKTPNKTYTIGSSTANHLGTYMLMDGAATPFVVHIPAFNGFLSPRYGITGNKVNEKDWRTRNVFQLKREDINRVIIKNIQKPKQSFALINGPLALLTHSGVEVDFNQEKALALLNGFKMLNCESYKD